MQTVCKPRPSECFLAFCVWLLKHELLSLHPSKEREGMKRKRHIARILLFISMMVLMVPVIPHHHHTDGMICMKKNITADCCEHSHHTPADDHSCCNTTGCIATHFVQQAPQSDNAGSHPDIPRVITLLIEPLINFPSLSESDARSRKYIYQETLHDTFVIRATGLRAPPSLLA